jgi:hypothetical protein
MEMSPTSDHRTIDPKRMEGYPYDREGEEMGSPEKGFRFGEAGSLGMGNGCVGINRN